MIGSLIVKKKISSAFEALNSGVTVIKPKKGKAFLVIDYFFDTGQNLREAWGEA